MIDERRAHNYCKDDLSKIENYDKAVADTTNTWDLHHRLELTLDGDFAHSTKELMRLDMYYHRPYFELIFLTHSEHRRLHATMKNHSFYGKHHSVVSLQKMKDSMTERRNMYRQYKSEGGEMTWNEFQRSVSK